MLILEDAFGDKTEIRWIRFCNTLQRHFFRATRQDSFRTFRALELFDFNYIHIRFFERKGNSKFFSKEKEIVNLSQFNRFWQWFGKSLQSMRYQRYVSKLWQNGLIYGFLFKKDVNDVLRNQVFEI